MDKPEREVMVALLVVAPMVAVVEQDIHLTVAVVMAVQAERTAAVPVMVVAAQGDILALAVVLLVLYPLRLVMEMAEAAVVVILPM
jgi:hypothetical protein